MPTGLRLEVDDVGSLLAYVRRDLLHLDADALHDRLHHWTLTDLAQALPRTSAIVSFRHAEPADPLEESHMDTQEGWRDLEPTLQLEDATHATDADLRTFAALVRPFLALVDAEGRPAGFRDPDVGNTE